MGTYNSSREMAMKMDDEGGLGELIFGYGFQPVDIPADMPPRMRSKLMDLLDMRTVYSEVQTWLYAEFDKDPRPGDYDYEEPGKISG